MIFVVALVLLELTHGKIYKRCELARELKFVQKAPTHQLGIWVCIAEHESQYNTSIVGHLNGDGSGDHGIFQISDHYWCSPPNKGYACGLTCADLEDDDISDDFLCAQKIYKEHKLISGDGFNAWAVYQPHCKGPKADRYIKDCFNDSEGLKTVTTSAPAFAHGFFDTAAGRAYKKLSFPTQKSAFELFLNSRSPSMIRSNEFAFITKKPMSNSFLTSKSSFYANNRFFTSETETPKLDFPFIHTTPSTFKFSTRTASGSISTRPSKTTSVMIFKPTISAFGNAGSKVSRTSIFGIKKAFSSTPSTTLLLTPTDSTPVHQRQKVNHPAPIFIFNGVKWY